MLNDIRAVICQEREVEVACRRLAVDSLIVAFICWKEPELECVCRGVCELVRVCFASRAWRVLCSGVCYKEKP